MAKAESTMLPLGTKVPIFDLPDTVSGNQMDFYSLKGERGTVFMFICNHCPYVIHVQEEVVKIANDFQSKGVGFVAISSNDVNNYPEDAPELMTEHAKKYKFNFPYLYDESQEVAKAFGAACTPDFYVFDSEDNCRYRGRMDRATPGNEIIVNGEELRAALTNLVKGLPIDTEQIASVGCGIKWKKN